MIAKQFEFDPSVITVNKGDHVIIHVKSVDVAHGFMIPEYAINVPIPGGQERTVEFDADKAGEFPFLCSIACGSGHRDMTGKLVVQG